MLPEDTVWQPSDNWLITVLLDVGSYTVCQKVHIPRSVYIEDIL